MIILALKASRAGATELREPVRRTPIAGVQAIARNHPSYHKCEIYLRDSLGPMYAQSPLFQTK